MRRRLFLLVLAILLQPLSATAGERTYGKAGVRTAQLGDASSSGADAAAVFIPADGLVAGTSLHDPPARPHLEAPRASLPPFRPLRGAPPADLRVTPRVGACPPHCERLPYHATAPPSR